MNRKLIVGLVAIAACAALIEWSSCGSSSSATPTPTPADAPIISDVTISGGNAVHSTVDLTADPIVTNVSTATSSVIVTFTSTATVTVPDGSVTLTCASGTAPTLGTPTSSDNVFTFAITGTFPQLATCTLAFSAEITNGTPMVAVSKNFATGCSTNDTLANTATITFGTGCWTSTGGGFTSTINSTNSGLIETLTADVTDSALGIVKSFANGSETTSVTITGATFSVNQSACGIVYSNPSASSVLMIAVMRDDGQLTVQAMNATGPLSAAPFTLSEPPSVSAPVVLTITSGPTTYALSCSQSGAACTPTLTELPPVISEATTIGLQLFGSSGASCTFGDGTASKGFIVTGASATGQD